MKEFIQHAKGFKIFLDSQDIADCDEYRDSDPYTVSTNIDSEFHDRRVKLTIDLINEVVAGSGRLARILDLGCGEGHITEKIRQSLNLSCVIGVDYSVSAIEYAHVNFPQVEFIVADAYDPPFEDNFLDLVVCNNLWEHVADPLALLASISRVIKPSGFLVISTPSRYRLSNLFRVLRGKPVVFMSKHHVTEYTVGQVAEQLAWGGFEVKKIISKQILEGSYKARIAKGIFSLLIGFIGSRHQLESTVFYLAQKLESEKGD